LDIKQGSQDLIIQRKNFLSFDSKVRNLEEFKGIYSEIKPDLEKVSNLFIDIDAPVRFIGFLEALSEDCQLSLEISPQKSSKKQKEDKWSSFFFEITLVGSFPDFFKFLEKLEHGPYLVQVQGLKIKTFTAKELLSQGLKDYSLGDVRANLSIKTFVQE